MPENPLDLGGRRVLIAGASGAIGREAAILLSELNARLVLTGRNHERLRQTLGLLHGDGHAIEIFDLNEVERIPEFVRKIAAEGGPFHGLVQAAGKQITSPIRTLSAQSLDSLMKTNLHSAVLLARGFCQRGCHEPGGAIVFVASIMALAGKPALAAYCASKAALVGLTRSLAVELARDRIRVNCVAPAFVRTEMLEQVRELLPPEQFAALERAHPLGFGVPRDVAHAIAFLLAETGRWVTGSTLVIDGGYSAQ